MTAVEDPRVAALEALAALIDARYYCTTLLTGSGRTPRLTVSHRSFRMADDIYADHDGWYWNGEPAKIAPFTDPATVAADLTRVLDLGGVETH